MTTRVGARKGRGSIMARDCRLPAIRTAEERPPLPRRRRTRLAKGRARHKRDGLTSAVRTDLQNPSEDVTDTAGQSPRWNHVGAAEDRLKVVEALRVRNVQHVELHLEGKSILLEPRAQRSAPDGARPDALGVFAETDEGGRIGGVRAREDVLKGAGVGHQP